MNDRNGRWRRIAVVACALALAAVADVRAQLPGNRIAQGVGLDQKLDSLIPLGLTFRDETGRSVRLAEYFGKRPVILTLAYYECPMLCTQVLNGLVGAMRTLKFDAGKEYQVITVSIDHLETPALAAGKKRQYMKDYGRAGTENGWHFLTGDSVSIKRLADAVGFRFMYDPESKEYAHASGIMVLTPEGRLSRYLYGIEYPPRDLRFSLIDASKSRIGSFTDKILMLCYNYDPHTGKYGVAIMLIVRLAGIVTVLGMVGFIVMSVRRERRARRLQEAVSIAASRN
jgi:protein SCO1/2